MAVVGTAYVAIRAVADKLKGDIEGALQGAQASAQKAGKDSGKAFQDGFNENGEVGPDLSSLADKAGEVGRQAGQKFKAGMSSGGGGADLDIDRALSGAVDDARDAGRRAADAVEEGFDDLDFGGVGNGGGNALGSGFAKGIEGSGASSSLGGIGARMIALVPLISILVGALSALASGLFAMGAAAGSAAGTLAALPVLAVAAASAMGLLKTAFSGVGDAFKKGISEQQNAADTASKNGKAMEAAARAVEAAQRGIGDAARANAEALRAANRAIEDARRSLSDTMVDTAARAERSDRSLFLAERSLRDALESQAEQQIKLTKARVDARHEVIALGFALEDAVLGEDRAAINLEKARRQLQLMSGLPPDNLMRKEAELSYKEAELNVRKTAEATIKAGEASDEAKKTGVENAAEVVNAKKSERDAAERVADAQYRLTQERKDHARTEKDIATTVMLAQRSLSDAITNRGRVQEDSARRTADAQRAMQDALEGVKDAAERANPAMSAFGKAMDNLAPAQRDFVNYLLSIRDKWKSLKATIAENVLTPAKSALEEFMTGGLFDTFSEGMDGASKSVGNFFTNLEETMKSPIFKGQFKQVMDNNVGIVDDFGGVLNNLVRLFVSVAAAAGPMTKRFSEWVKTITGDWADKADKSGSRMEAFFKKAGDTAAQLGRIVGNVASGIYKLGQTAAPAGQTLLDSFEGATKKFKELTDGPGKKEQFKKFFADVATNVQKIGDLLVAVGDAFAGFGDNQGIGTTADTLRLKVIPAIEFVIDLMNSKAAPAIAEFLGAVGDAIKALSESPALDIVLGTLTTLADVITAFATNPAGQAFIVVMGTIVGVMKSLAIVKKVLMIDHLVNGFKKLDTFVGKKTGQKLSELFKGVGDDAENAAKRVNDAFDPPDGDGKGKGKNNTPDGVDKNTNRAGKDFEGNLRSLAGQFKLTGEAKDAFIRNLQKLSGQFAATGAAATGKAGKAATGAGAAGAGVAAADLVDDVDIDKSVKGAGKLDDAAGKATKSGGKLSGLFKGLKGAAGGLSLALLGVSGATLAAMWPILLIVGVIAGLVLLFKGAWDHSEKLREAFDKKLKPAFEKLWTAIKPAIDGLKKLISEGLKKVGDFIADVLIPGLVIFVEWIAEHIPPVIEFFKGVFDFIKEHWGIISDILFAPFKLIFVWLPKVIGFIVTHFDDAVGWVVDAWNSVLDFFKELPGKIGGFFVGLWDKITGGVGDAVDWIQTKWTQILDFFQALPGKIGDFFVGLWDGITDGLGTAKDWVGQKLGEIVDFVKGLPGKFVEGNKKIWAFITDGIDTARQFVSDKIDAIVEYVKATPERFVNNVKNMWGFITDTLGVARDFVAEKIDAIVDFVAGMPGRFVANVTNLWGFISDGLETAYTFVSEKITAIADFVLGLPARFIAGASNLWGFFTTGLEIVWAFVSEKINGIATFVLDLPARFVRGTKRIWGFITDTLATARATVMEKLNGILTFVKGLPGKFLANASRLWNFLTSGVGTATQWVRDKLESVVRLVSGLPGRIGRATGNMWDGIKNSFKNALNWLIGKWNNFRFTIGGGSFLGQTIPSFTLNTPDIPYLAKGGIVPATPGGRLTMIGEAGQAEKVTPLNSRGLSRGEEMMLELLSKKEAPQQIHITINPPPGTDVQTLARLVSLELGFQRR